MTKPDLRAELAEVVRLLDDMQSWIGPRRPDARDAEEREQWDQIERAKTTIRAHHAELEAVVRDAGYWRKLMQWHDAPKGNKYATVVFWEAEPHEPENALELVNAMNRAMHNSAREG